MEPIKITWSVKKNEVQIRKFLIQDMKKIFSLVIVVLLLISSNAFGQYKIATTIGESMATFNEPVSVTIDNEGNVYGIDNDARRVLKFDKEGNVLSYFGESRNALDITNDADGNLFVLYEDVCYKFNPQGKVMLKFGDFFSEDFKFEAPMSLAIHNNKLYVADKRYRINENIAGIIEFDLNGKHLNTLGERYEGGISTNFNSFSGIAIDGDGNFYIGHISENIVYKLNASGKTLLTIGKEDGVLMGTRGIAIGETGNIYIANAVSNDVAILDKQGKLIKRFGSEGTEDGQFNRILGLKTDIDGNIYVADKDNGNIQKFTSEGELISSFGSQPTVDQMKEPKGIALDKDGYLYVSDTKNKKIRKFNSDGKLLLTFPTVEDEDDQSEPLGLAVDREGNILVCDKPNNIIRVFNKDGDLVKTIGESRGDLAEGEEMSYPVDIAIDSEGSIFVLQFGFANKGILQFDKNGTFVKYIKIDSDYGYNFLTLDDSGNFYVAGSGIRKFDKNGTFISNIDGSRFDSFGSFNSPRGVSVYNGVVYALASKDGGRVMQFDQEGNMTSMLEAKNMFQGVKINWSDLVINKADGSIYTINMKTSQILRITK